MLDFTKGVLFKLLNLNIFCLLSITLFLIGVQMPLEITFFILNCLSSLILLPFIWPKITKSFWQRNLRSFMLRAFLNTMGIYTWVLAMHYIGPNEATAISFSIPIFTMLLSHFFCKDKFYSHIIYSLIICLIGGAIIIAPRLSMEFTPLGCVFVTLSALCWAGYDVVCRLQSKSEDFMSQSFKNFIFSAVISLVVVLLTSSYRTVEVMEIINEKMLYILFASVFSIVNVMVLFMAYKSTAISGLMPLSYLRLFFMSIYTYMFFGTVINMYTFIGGTVVFLANMLNYRLSKRAAARSLLTM